MAEQKELLRKLGEESIYSAKGHFKAADLRRTLTLTAIWGCAILAVASLLVSGEFLSKTISVLSLTGSIALLIWNQGDGIFYSENHRKAAEKYLEIHKEIRLFYFKESVDSKEIETVSKKLSKLDASKRPHINYIAKQMAKRAIESKDPETDNWFKHG